MSITSRSNVPARLAVRIAAGPKVTARPTMVSSTAAITPLPPSRARSQAKTGKSATVKITAQIAMGRNGWISTKAK